MSITKQRWLIVLCALAALIFVVSAGTTVAAWRAQGTALQHTEIASLTGELIETGTENAVIYPQEQIPYAVYAKNTGTVDGLVRVSVDTLWGISRSEDGALIADPKFDLAYIELDYNTVDWIFDPATGYYYYTGVLAPEETTPVLFDAVTLLKQTTNDYAGVQFDIICNMEMVQAGYNGISYWGKTMDEFGIVYEESLAPSVTGSAAFEGPEIGFSFAGDNALLVNMENLQPGETRSQQVNVTNVWNEATEISLQLRPQSEVADPHTLELFSQHAQLSVSDRTGTVLYEGPLWNDRGTPVAINLGTFSAGAAKDLNVQLSIDSNVDNAFSDLYGETLWVFMAEGVETPIAPETGETKAIFHVAMAVFIVSGLLLLILLALLIGRKKREWK